MKASALFALVAAVAAQAASEWNAAGWSVARSQHFEVYSQAGPDRARLTLMRFEELRAFFDQNPPVDVPQAITGRPPLRVVEFQTAKQYSAVQLRPNADAYYTAAEDRDYIVMPVFARNDVSLAAHEYAHFVLHARGLKLPPWLSEGIAEVMSPIDITNFRCELGGPKPALVATLRRNLWASAAQLLTQDTTARETRDGAAIFYAESWALTDMLTSAPVYAPHFAELVNLLNSGVPSQQALTKIYGKSAEAILTDTRTWIRRGTPSRRKFSPLTWEAIAVEVSPVHESQTQAVIADLLLTNGNLDRAERIYQELLRQAPRDPDLLASLGTVALRKGNPRQAVDYWSQALEAHLNNPALCYRYAVVADQMNLPSEETGQALERAISLQPNFDDARFKLAQLRSNAGDYSEAVKQLQAMRDVPPGRAFGYWTSLSYALSELGERKEAEAAADRAKRFAATSEETSRAAKLAYIATTDLSVQSTRDAEGKLQLITTRVPHGIAAMNPFIEEEDHILSESGHLQEVQCSEGRLTGFVVESVHGYLTLSVLDPSRILIKNGPSEFICGPQNAVNVKVQYASTAQSDRGILRGMEF